MESETMLTSCLGGPLMKDILMQGILADQDGQDTLEYVAIAGTVILIALAVFAIIRRIAIEGAEKISW